MKRNNDYRLVYSTDPELNRKCKGCNELISECTCVPEEDPRSINFIAILRIEKKGRKGKAVTVIDRLPKNESYLKELTTKLKKKCGSGGTYLVDSTHGVIEIQGDKRATIREIFSKDGIRYKG